MAKYSRIIGVSGLTQYGGMIDEEWLNKLKGDLGKKRFREMADNDDTVGSILFAIEMLLRNVEWRVEPFDDTPDRKEDAEFVESLMQDLSHTWEDLIAEILTMLIFGFAPFEIIYKLRGGPTDTDKTRQSKFTDNKIGWRKIELRAQETIYQWEFNEEDGEVTGLWQMPPLSGANIFIPIDKLIVFKTTSRKSNPEGRSILRSAWIKYSRKLHIEDMEAIGVERDLAGMPMFYVPTEMTDENADAATKAQLEEYKKIGRNIKNDQQACLVLPSIFDEANNRLLEFKLLSTGGTRQFDTSAIIQRLDNGIARTVLADFIMLGHEKVGSFALSSDKTELFSTALGAWLKEIAAVLNRYALPKIYELNGMNLSEMAEFVPGDIEKKDMDRFSTAVTNLTGAGWLTPGGEDDENYIRDYLDLPQLIAGASSVLDDEDL